MVVLASNLNYTIISSLLNVMIVLMVLEALARCKFCHGGLGGVSLPVYGTGRG